MRMRQGKASATSTLVAFMRALADAGVTGLREFDDAVTREVLPLPLRLLVKGIKPLPRTALRAAWHAARAAGVRQLVVLGAGLDMRAWRLADLQGVALFEVDHPATQAAKRRQVAALQAHTAMTFVAVDLTRDDLAARLRAAGFRDDVPAMWIWQGVVMYLPRQAVAATLATLAALSAPGSRLAMTYVTPDHAAQPALGGLLRIVTLIGEPFLGMLTTAEVAGLLADAGLRLLSDTDPVRWAALYSEKPPLALNMVSERLAVAELPAAVVKAACARIRRGDQRILWGAPRQPNTRTSSGKRTAQIRRTLVAIIAIRIDFALLVRTSEVLVVAIP